MLPDPAPATLPPVKIATLNINNINKRLGNLLAWLRAAKPDVVCLQELKSTDAAFPVAELRRAGYQAVWRGEKSWNGVAILARNMEPVLTRTELPGNPRDAQSRYIEAAVSGILIGCLYAPNGNPQPGAKFDYKLAWLERLNRHAATLRKANVPAVLIGDYNIVPTERDIYPTKSYDKDALLQPQSRAAFTRLIKQGWTDALRALHPDARIYTYWDYLRNRWPRDAGLRLDHILLSPDLAPRLKASGVDRAVRGKPNASDHAPVWVQLGAPKKTRATNTARRVPKPSKARVPKRTAARKAGPLLVIDGDSFAHRAYHALPKTILRPDGKQAGAILGFANMLLRFYEAEHPRAMLVAWDTLDAPTYRNKLFPAYQSGRKFDAALIEQLRTLPQFIRPAASPTRRRPASRRMIFSPPLSPRRIGAKGRYWSRAAIAIRSSSSPRGRPFFIRFAQARWRGLARKKSARVTASSRGRCRTSSRCAATHPTSCPARPDLAPQGRPACLANTERWRMRSRQAGTRHMPASCACSVQSRR